MKVKRVIKIFSVCLSLICFSGPAFAAQPEASFKLFNSFNDIEKFNLRDLRAKGIVPGQDGKLRIILDARMFPPPTGESSGFPGDRLMEFDPATDTLTEITPLRGKNRPNEGYWYYDDADVLLVLHNILSPKEGVPSDFWIWPFDSSKGKNSPEAAHFRSGWGARAFDLITRGYSNNGYNSYLVNDTYDLRATANGLFDVTFVADYHHGFYYDPEGKREYSVGGRSDAKEKYLISYGRDGYRIEMKVDYRRTFEKSRRSIAHVYDKRVFIFESDGPDGFDQADDDPRMRLHMFKPGEKTFVSGVFEAPGITRRPEKFIKLPPPNDGYILVVFEKALVKFKPGTNEFYYFPLAQAWNEYASGKNGKSDLEAKDVLARDGVYYVLGTVYRGEDGYVPVLLEVPESSFKPMDVREPAE